MILLRLPLTDHLIKEYKTRPLLESTTERAGEIWRRERWRKALRQKSRVDKSGQLGKKRQKLAMAPCLGTKTSGPTGKPLVRIEPQPESTPLQVPFGMATVMTPQAGKKRSPRCSNWIISWVLEDVSPKRKKRQVGQSDPPHDRAQERKLNITKRTLEEGLAGTTLSSSGHADPSISTTGRSHMSVLGKGQNLGHRTAMDLHSVTRPGRGQQCESLG